MKKYRLSLFFLLAGCCSICLFQTSFANAEAQQIDRKVILQDIARGNYQKALANANELLGHNSNDAVAIFLKGMANYLLGNTALAMDLWKLSSEKDPDYDQPRVERAKHFLKKGMVEEAFHEVNSDVKQTADVKKILSSCAKAHRLITTSGNAFENRRWETCRGFLAELLASDLCPLYDQGRKMYVACFANLGNTVQSIQESIKMLNLQPQSPNNNLQMAIYFLALGNATNAAQEVLKCRRSDPDHRGCTRMFKAMKAITSKIEHAETMIQSAAERKRGLEELAAAHQTFSLPQNNPLSEFQQENMPNLIDGYMYRIVSGLCKGHLKSSSGEAGKEALKWCSIALKGREKEPENMMDIAEAYMLAEEYETAKNKFQEILRLHPEHPQAQEGLAKAQNLLRQSKRKDYYKILGVNRNATDKEIQKAYRKLAMEYHPDKCGKENADYAQKKMAEINTAYEVLRDADSRAKYNQGFDPNDPEAGRGGGGPFFHHFGSAGGGGRQQFHFGQPGGGGGFQFEGDVFEMFARQQQQQQQRGRQQQRGYQQFHW